MLWFWLTLIYLLFLVSAQVINKKSLNDDGIDELVFGASVQIATALVSLVLAIFTGWKFSFNSLSIPLFLGMGATYFCAVSFYFSGLKNTDLSITAILDSIGSIFSLILGVLLLSEPLVANKLIGVALVILANLTVFLKNKGIKFNKYSLILVASTFFYALGAVFDKKLNSFGNALSYIALSFAFAGFSMLIVYFKRTKKAFSGTFKNINFWKGIAINGVLYSLGFWALFSAYNVGGEVSRMFPITLSASIIVPVAGIIILGEKEGVIKKVIAVAIMTFGLWFLGK